MPRVSANRYPTLSRAPPPSFLFHSGRPKKAVHARGVHFFDVSYTHSLCPAYRRVDARMDADSCRHVRVSALSPCRGASDTAVEFWASSRMTNLSIHARALASCVRHHSGSLLVEKCILRCDGDHPLVRSPRPPGGTSTTDSLTSCVLRHASAPSPSWRWCRVVFSPFQKP